MKLQQRFVLACVCVAIALAAPACNRKDGTSISDINTGTSIAFDNQVERPTDRIATSTKTIYLSARVTNPTAKTAVRVRWYQMPNTLIASEDFSGRKSGGGVFDFDRDKTASVMAASIEKDGLTWPLGEYRAEVWLNNKLFSTAFFTVVSDSEAEALSAQNLIKTVKVSDRLGDDDKISSSKSKFQRTANAIYIQVDVSGAPTGTQVRTTVRYVKDDLSVADISTSVLGDDSPVYTLSRERFGQLWPDRLWAAGSYEVSVYANGLLAKTYTFIVQ